MLRKRQLAWHLALRDSIGLASTMMPSICMGTGQQRSEEATARSRCVHYGASHAGQSPRWVKVKIVWTMASLNNIPVPINGVGVLNVARWRGRDCLWIAYLDLALLGSA